jgi:hypothetical protein
MVKILLNVLFTSCLSITLTSHATTEAAINLNALENKFDTKVAELTDERATYIVYFGDNLNTAQLKKNSFSATKDKNSFTLKMQQQVSVNRENILKSFSTEDYQLVHSYKAVPAMVIRA